jgi:hypothetical protein
MTFTELQFLCLGLYACRRLSRLIRLHPKVQWRKILYFTVLGNEIYKIPYGMYYCTQYSNFKGSDRIKAGTRIMFSLTDNTSISRRLNA